MYTAIKDSNTSVQVNDWTTEYKRCFKKAPLHLRRNTYNRMGDSTIHTHVGWRGGLFLLVSGQIQPKPCQTYHVYLL